MGARALSSIGVVLAALAMAVLPSPASALPPERGPVATTDRAANGDGGTFQSVPQTRILDTRTGTGAPAAAIAAGATLDLNVAGQAGVPAHGVAAVVLNVTVTQATANGHLIEYAEGTTRPATSNLNFTAGRTVANLAISAIGSDGGASIYNASAGSIELLADLSGFYSDGSPGAGGYASVTPARLLDTRAGVGAPVPGLGSLSFAVTGQAGVPGSGVSSAVVNLTVANPVSGGYVVAGPGGGTVPKTSTVNFGTAQTVANLSVVPVGSDGTVTVYNRSPGSVQLIVDVFGYFTSGPAARAGSFSPLTPARLLDTRNGTGGTAAPVAAHHVIDLTVLGHGSVPASGATSAVLNVTATRATGAGYVLAYPSLTARPGTSNVNFGPGASTANLDVVTVGSDGQIALYNGSPGTVQIVVDVLGFVVAPSPTFAAVPLDRGLKATDVSCSNATSCTALGTDSASADTRWTHFDGTSWSAPAVLTTLPTATGIKCVSATFCLAWIGTLSVRFNGTRWSAPQTLPAAFSLTDRVPLIDCTTGGMCIATGGDVHDDPVAARLGSTSWSTIASPPNLVYALSCATSTCTATPANAGTQNAMIFGGTAWSQTTAPPLTVNYLSCGPDFCLALARGGRDAPMSSMMTGDTWSTPVSLPAPILFGLAVSCASATRCVAIGVDSDGSRARNYSTVFNGSSWSTPVVVPHSGADFGGPISCPTSTFCVYSGYVLLTFGGTWSTTTGLPGTPADVSCTSPTSCLAVDDFGRSLRWDGTAWTAVPAAPGIGSFAAVSCITSTHCVAVGTAEDREPAASVWNGGTWSAAQPLVGMTDVADVSCTASTFCLAVGGSGTDGEPDASDPSAWSRFNGSTWTTAVSLAAGLDTATRVSCTSPTFCAAVSDIVTDDFPFAAEPAVFDGTTWTAAARTNFGDGGFPALSCAPVTTGCVSATYLGAGLEYNGTAWVATSAPGGVNATVNDMSCTSSTDCIAVGGNGSTAAAWRYDGSSWSAPLALGTPIVSMINAVSCPTADFCATIGYS